MSADVKAARAAVARATEVLDQIPDGAPDSEIAQRLADLAKAKTKLKAVEDVEAEKAKQAKRSKEEAARHQAEKQKQRHGADCIAVRNTRTRSTEPSERYAMHCMRRSTANKPRSHPRDPIDSG